VRVILVNCDSDDIEHVSYVTSTQFFKILSSLHRLKINIVSFCIIIISSSMVMVAVSTSKYTAHQQDGIGIIAPTRCLFHYFLSCHFSFKPTFSRTQRGSKTRINYALLCNCFSYMVLLIYAHPTLYKIIAI
jgi:hypothetical protein